MYMYVFSCSQLLTRLQADEAMIKSLTEQVNELTSSDTLSRVRDSYSSALAQSNQQHQQELLTLQQQIGELREEVDKKVHVHLCIYQAIVCSVCSVCTNKGK